MILQAHAPWRCNTCGSAMTIVNQVESKDRGPVKLLMTTGYCPKYCVDAVESKIEMEVKP